MTQPKPPSLEVISKDGKAAIDERERRRLPRLNLTTEQFRLAANGKIFSVTDLSTEGMALRVIVKDDLALFPVAGEVAGMLNLRGQKHEVRARVRHLGPDVVGCEFTELPPSSRAALDRFLDPAVLGSELKPIPASENSATWYHGPSGTDLLLWRRTDGQYFRIALFVFGSYVQWEEGKGLSSGRTQVSEVDRSEVRGIVRFETMMLSPDAQPDPGKLNIAKTLVLSSNLSQDLKKWCVRHFEP